MNKAKETAMMTPKLERRFSRLIRSQNIESPDSSSPSAINLQKASSLRIEDKRRKKITESKINNSLKSDGFHTLPSREPIAMISRKDIIRRTCSKTENHNDTLTRLTQSLRKRWKRSSSLMLKKRNEKNAIEDDDYLQETTRTLPSLRRRSSGKDRDATTLIYAPMTRISRQEIIRRNSTIVNGKDNDDQRRKSSASLYDTGQQRHAGCFVKNTTAHFNSRTDRGSERWKTSHEKNIQVPRPSTLPKSMKNSRAQHENKQQQEIIVPPTPQIVYGRLVRRKISVPLVNPDPMTRKISYRSIRDTARDPQNYGMLNHRSSMPNLPQRTMSRRRIIDNAEEAVVTKSLGRKARKPRVVEVSTLPSNVRSRTRHWYDSPTSLVQESRKSGDSEKRRNSRIEESTIQTFAGSSKSLTSYVMKNPGKTSYIPLRIDRPRNDFSTKSLNRVEINGTKKISNGGRAATPYLVYGLCTGRRKVMTVQKVQVNDEKDLHDSYETRKPRVV